MAKRKSYGYDERIRQVYVEVYAASIQARVARDRGGCLFRLKDALLEGILGVFQHFFCGREFIANVLTRVLRDQIGFVDLRRIG